MTRKLLLGAVLIGLALASSSADAGWGRRYYRPYYYRPYYRPPVYYYPPAPAVVAPGVGVGVNVAPGVGVGVGVGPGGGVNAGVGVY